MAFLRVRLKGKTVLELSLEEGKEYIAGRKEDCEILLMPEKGISREHFKLKHNGTQWLIEVVSRYGEVQFNGENVQELLLQPGFVFSVSPYEFDFSNESYSKPEELERSSDRLPALNESRSMQSQDSDFDREEKTLIGAAPTSAYIKITDANNDAKELIRLDDGESWISGRDSTSHIQIKDQRVSRKQFEIRRQGPNYQIMDLGSVNGTLLNGNPLSSGEYTTLKSGDAISVLDNYLYFELHDSQYQNRLDLVKASPVNSMIPAESNYHLPDYQAPSPYGIQNYQGPIGDHSLEPQLPPARGLAALKNFDFQKNRPKVIAAAIGFLAVVYFFSGGSGSDSSGSGTANGLQTASQQAFAKLSTEQQALVRQRYKDAKNLYMQGKYQLAQDEIVKISELVVDYEDVAEIERLSKEAIFIQEQKRRQEQIENARIETEEKIQIKVAECKKLLNPQVTPERVEDCLSAVLQFNPDHPKILELKAQAEAIVNQRLAQSAERAAYQGQVSRLRGLYKRAETSHKKGRVHEALSAYDRVIQSGLPDPSGLKNQSKRNIASIRQTMNTKTAAFQAEAEKHYQSQNLKGAILALRKARHLDPSNADLTDRIEKHTVELRKQMMSLYQEGILEESFGNVEGGESKAGAKDKWKKILDLDIPEGEYYKKAFIKLKKYGAL